MTSPLLERKNKVPIILMIFFGMLSGFITGFLGAGGGLVTILFLRFISRKHYYSINDKDALVNSLAVSIPTAFISLINLFLRSGSSSIEKASFEILFPAAILGGLLGAFFLNVLNAKIVRLIFSSIVIFSGCWLIFK